MAEWVAVRRFMAIDAFAHAMHMRNIINLSFDVRRFVDME